ncbi:MAG: hypothetical protein ACO1QR_00560 [Chthoniobacteraceae bacterium]
MIHRYLLLLLLSLVTMALAPAALSAEESLYDETRAKKLNPSQFSLFGPRSSSLRYDSRMIKAAEIAAARARKHSISRCWRYVKKALLASEVIDSYPKTAYAKQAGAELQKTYGFQRLRVTDPYQAPLGSVLVYGGRGAGHVEIRTSSGFVSDFASVKPSPRPLIGVYVKPKG